MTGSRRWLVMLPAAAILGACSSKAPQDAAVDGYPDDDIDIARISDAVPRAEPLSKYGNPKSYSVLGKTYRTLKKSDGFVQRGVGSFYGTKFHGRRTSSGEPYDMYKMTAAHKRLPLPTYVEVTNLDNGRKVVVKVNDRGPFHDNRIIDLSYAAATKLGIANRGTGRVEIRAVNPAKTPTATAVMATDTKTAAAATSPAADTRLYVQAGAFSQRANAETLIRLLREEHARNALIRSSRRDGTSVYKVYVGPVASRDEADGLSAYLRETGITGAHTVLD